MCDSMRLSLGNRLFFDGADFCPVLALDGAEVLGGAVRQIVVAFEPLDTLDTDAADQLQAVGREIAGFVVVARRAGCMDVVRVVSQRGVAANRPVVARVTLP